MKEKELLKAYLDKVRDEQIEEKKEIQFCKSTAIKLKNEREERKRAY
jgi:hypothetical protein